jgi:hypothetical protein
LDHTCEKRNDEWAQEVRSRLEYCSNDLVAADATYHKLCDTRFNKCLAKEAGTVKPGRPIKEAANEAFNLVCKKLEKSYESGMYTISQLHAMMVDFLRNRTADKNETMECTDSVNIDPDIDCSQDTEIDEFDSDIESSSNMETEDSFDENCSYDDLPAAVSADGNISAEFNAYSRQYLLVRLKQKYGEHLYVTNLHGRKNFVSRI